MSLRVCHLGKYYPPAPGGIETHVRTLAQAQAELGAEVRVFCVNHLPGPTAEEQDGPVRVTRFGRFASLFKLDLCRGLTRALKHCEADVLHLQVPNPAMLLACLYARPKPPVVVTYQSDYLRQRISGAIFRPFERAFFRRASAILATSPPYASSSVFLQAYRERLGVLPMGIDLRPYMEPSAADRAAAEEIRAKYGSPIWFSCGRLIYYKGLEHAVRALAHVPGTLLIVGEGPERGRLETEAQRLGVSGRVVFCGALPYPKIVPYYLAATAFWFPSNARTEAFGLVQVEAMASGCPVLNTAIPGSGVPWVSRHEETGLTVPLNNPQALAASARRLLEEPGLREKFAAATRERAQREFDHRVMAERSLEIYRKVLACRSAGAIECSVVNC